VPFGPRLEGRQVVLRPPVAADEGARQRLGRHEEIQRMYGVVTPRRGPMTHEDARAWFVGLGATDTVEWVIEVERQLAGSARLHHFDDARCAKYAIGFFDPLLLGRGLGTEATILVLGHAFGRLGLDEVRLDVLAFNERAIRCYRNAGFRAEGTKPSRVVIDDEEIEDVVMSITAAEFAHRGSRSR
jgi:RimJ/RimL family protein N-acetyltransferase